MIDFRDDREGEATPLRIDEERLNAALDAAQVDTHGIEVRLRLRTQTDTNHQGFCKRIREGVYRVVVYVADKEAFEDRHLYVINNSLVHELRHIAQWQLGMPGDEIDARYYGRLADHTGKKNTGKAGPALGKDVWAVLP